MSPVLPSLSTGVGDFALYFVSLEHGYCAARGFLVFTPIKPKDL